MLVQYHPKRNEGHGKPDLQHRTEVLSAGLNTLSAKLHFVIDLSQHSSSLQ